MIIVIYFIIVLNQIIQKENILIQTMYRNTTLSPSYANSFQTYQGRANSFSKTGTQFNQSRSPLYPIGPTLTQQQFHPMKRAPSPSPYITSKKGIKPPSYEQRYLRTDIGFQHAQRGSMDRTYNYEQRQKRLIQRNQTQIQQQQKRRQTLGASYQRQIQNTNRLLLKNLERKQKLLLQTQVLQKTNQQYHQQLTSLVPPKQSVDLYEPLDRKQQDIIITKNKLLTNIREKQEEYLKEEQQQEQYWQNQLREKEKILLKNQQDLKNRRMELHSTKLIVEKPDFLAIQDEVRDQKYHDFLYEAKVIQDRIQNMIKQRQNQQRQVDQALKTKRQNIHSLLMKHEQTSRQCVTSRIRTQQLFRVSKQMQAANQSLMHQLQRKQKMIQKYQLDIHTLKQSKQQQQSKLNSMIKRARQDYQQEEMENGIEDEIQKVQEVIREESSITNRLKSQYQKLYEILCSTASRNIHQTFNFMLVA